MSKVLRSIPVILLLCIATISSAEEPLISVRAVGADTFPAHTRQAVSFVLAIGNGGPQHYELILEPSLPSGWKALAQDGRFILAPWATDLHVVSCLVPLRTPAGAYVLHYRVRDISDPSVNAECSLKIIILPEISLELKLLDSPAFVLAGYTYTVSFVLSNTGNTDVLADLGIQNESSVPYEVLDTKGASQVAVPVDGVKKLSVSVRTNAHLIKSMYHQVQVSIRIRRPGRGVESHAALPALPAASAVSRVEVIPISIDEGILIHTDPVGTETSAIVGYDQKYSGVLQESAIAQGTLDKAGEHKIELDLKKQIDTYLDPFFNPMDCYSFLYQSRFGELQMGDLPYTISPLLAMDEFARGIQGTMNLFPLRLGALYYKDVWSEPGAQGLGGTVDFTVPRSGGAWDDVLYRAGASVFSPLSDRISFGFLQQLNPVENVQLQIDAALQSDSKGALSPAVFAFSQGGLRRVRVDGPLHSGLAGFPRHLQRHPIHAGAC